MLPDVEARRVKQAQRWEAERSAVQQLQQNMADGDELAFVPANNNTLTRKLKQCVAYEILKEEGDYGTQIAGLHVREQDLLEILSEVGGPTQPGA